MTVRKEPTRAHWTQQHAKRRHLAPGCVSSVSWSSGSSTGISTCGAGFDDAEQWLSGSNIGVLRSVAVSTTGAENVGGIGGEETTTMPRGATTESIRPNIEPTSQ